MLETQILCLTYYPVTYFEVLGRPWRDMRRPTIPGVAQAKDGLVDLGCGTAQQWFDLCAMVGHPEWIDEESPLSITEQANIHAEEIFAWMASTPVDEIRELASAFRIPNAPVANGANVTSFDQFVERDSFVAQSARRVRAAESPISDAARAVAPTAAGAAAGGAHRALPRREPSGTALNRPVWRNRCRSPAFGSWT